MHITLLKLGGSLITDKSKAYTALPDEINRIATEIKKAIEAQPDMHLILGNGAGSYAHQSAAKYDTMNGFIDENSLYGACVVHQDAMDLNRLVVKELHRKHIPAFSVQPSAVCITRNKQLVQSQFSVIDTLLQNKYIPVLYGDVIADEELGATIFSTDTIFRYVAEYLGKQQHVVRVIHAGSYPGVLDNNEQLIENITPDTYPGLLMSLHEAVHIDVTGGMKLKVQEMIDLTQYGIESQIIDGREHNAIFKALLGEKQGTTINSS